LTDGYPRDAAAMLGVARRIESAVIAAINAVATLGMQRRIDHGLSPKFSVYAVKVDDVLDGPHKGHMGAAASIGITSCLVRKRL
jgi:hypothetical protein